MKFAHLADCHIGGWREPKLRDINHKAFSKAVDMCIESSVDFVLIAGDLFDTASPGHDSLMLAVTKLRKLKDKNIPVYVAAGSHDFSPSGKTILDVLETAGLLTNVARADLVDDKLSLVFTVDKKTSCLIAGLPGRKGMLDRSYYESLDRDIKEKGFKVFVFHTCITEYKPEKDMDSVPISILPKGFDYYAGGHVHYVFSKKEEDFGIVAFPGPCFPNNFKELEDLGSGGFYLFEDGKLEWQPVNVINTLSITLDCNNRSADDVENSILPQLKNKELNDTVVTIRLHGTLANGKPSDINYRSIFDACYAKSAYFVMKNTNKLCAKGFEEVKVEKASVEDIESALVAEHAGQSGIFSKDKEAEMISCLMRVLSLDKAESEKVADFNKRLGLEVSRLLGD
ncbi:MAG: DNA repair exonuclease [Candidatus Woesearchaeota archaeon]